jgi:hypothetical protein
MAKVLGETGRYVAEQATKKLLRLLLLLYVFGISIGFLSGYMLGARQNLITLLVLPLLLLLWQFFAKKFKAIETDRINFRKGVMGEAVIGYILEGFPDDYRVIHDLSTPFGNIDHVVIGPAGAYVIDAKNWKGVVAADGSGELLLNGKPTQKTEIKNLTRRIMSIKEKINVLSSLDPYVQGVFAFPSAYVEAKWGTTGYIHCIRDEQLYEYIVENKRSKKLSTKEIETISQSFLALARMDKDFGQNSK